MPRVAEHLEWLERPAAAPVAEAEYARLLGYPRGRELEGRARELAEEARAWYGRHGRPWLYARQAEAFTCAGEGIEIEGASFTCARLAGLLQKSAAHSLVLAACGAGVETEMEAARRWRDDKPDEYFFLEMFGAAVVEWLVTELGARLCAWAEARQWAVLPHYSPGYPGWDIAEQPRLLALLTPARGQARPAQAGNFPAVAWPEPLEALDSGMLRPRKSQLMIFGLTRHGERLRRLSELSPCENCSFGPCQYRRAAYRRAGTAGEAAETAAPDSLGPALAPDALYSVNRNALARWARERLTITPAENGILHATFRYDGTTCTNLGCPLAFLYSIELGPKAEGYPIRSLSCAPVPGDTGYRQMCKYLENAEALLSAIAAEKPLLGQPLDAVLHWRRGTLAAACYCEPEGRERKWGLALETLHYALARRETDAGRRKPESGIKA